MGETLADKLLRDRSLSEKLVPTDATQYLAAMRKKMVQERCFWFKYLESSTKYVLKAGVGRLYESGFYSDNVKKEPKKMLKAYKRVVYLTTAMDGFPDDPNPSWWKRGPVAWWANRYRRHLFGES